MTASRSTWSFGRIDAAVFFGAGPVLTRGVAAVQGRFGVAVVTGQRLLDTPSHEEGATLLEWLRDAGVELYVVENVNEDPIMRRLVTPTTLGISLGAPWRFRQPLIEAFGGRLINGHNARLPQDRGGGGFSWRIMRRQRTGGSVLHLVTSELDAGPILKSREYVFPSSYKIPRDFEAEAATQLYELLRELLEEVEQGKGIEVTPQPESLSTYWPRLQTEIHGYIDWSWSLQDLEAFIDAFGEPYAGAATFWNGQRVRLRNATAESIDGMFHPFQAGIIYRTDQHRLFVAAKEGSLVIGEVLSDAGAQILHRMRVGDRFYTPLEHLEHARSTRIAYTATGVTNATRSTESFRR